MSGSSGGVFIDGLPAASVTTTADLFVVGQGGTPGVPGTSITRQVPLSQVLTSANLPTPAGLVPAASTIANLRTYGGSAQLVYVEGYATGADGGGGLFYLAQGDTTSADNGGTIIVSSNGNRWFRDGYNAGTINARWFGVIPGADCTAAFQRALQAAASIGQAIYVPAALTPYYVSSALVIANPVNIYGDAFQTTISSTNATTDIFTVNSGFVSIRGLNFATTVTKSAGAFITLNSASVTEIYECWFTGYSLGLNVTENYGSQLTCRKCAFRDGNPTTGIGIEIKAGFAMVLDEVLMDSTLNPKPIAGINVHNCGDLTITGSEIIRQENGLLLNPNAGETCASVWVTDSFFDTCGSYGVLYAPNGGSIVRSRFIGCWMSSAGIRGVSFNGASGTINGVDFTDCHVFGNTQDGFYLFQGAAINIEGCEISGNGAAGVSIGGTISQFIISGCLIGLSGGFGGNQYGVFLGGSNLRFIISNNIIIGNTAQNIANPNSAGNWLVTNNITS